MGVSRRDLLETLAQRIREIEAVRRPRGRVPLSLGVPVLEALLPEKRLPAGSLVEFLSAADGAGAWTLALVMARRVCGDRKALVVCDGQGCFYPPAASRLGVDLDRTIVLRPAAARDAYAAVDQSLRCAAVGAVVGWHEHLRMLDFRRLQRAAESGGGVGFLLRPSAALRVSSCATIRFLVAPIQSPRALRRIRVDVVRCRGGKGGQSLVLEIDDETGDVHLSAAVADPAALPRSARASG